MPQRRHMNPTPVTAVPETPAPPLSAEEFADLMMPFALSKAPHIAIAVSGGPDSMALAWCVKRWVEEKEPSFPQKRESSASDSERMSQQKFQFKQPVKILDDHLRHTARRRAPLDSRFRGNDGSFMAFIVDHQLRLESSAEAKQTKQRLAALGIKTEILRWEHPPIASKIHVAARKARYALLLEACKKHGIDNLLLAHQREDQAETILMRLAKGSGIDGLAGIAPVNSVEGVRLLRPFLFLPKERLIATCKANGIAFVTDPSNAAAKYARGRLRKVLPLLADEGLTSERLIDLGDRAREAKEALDHYTQNLLRVAAQMDSAGVIRLNLEQLRSAPKAVALRALGACLCAVHPTDYQPERAVLLPLLEALCNDAPTSARTVHGCVVSKTASKATVLREPSAITDIKPIAPGETVLWDGRWQVTLSPECKQRDLVIRALGVQSHEIIDKLAPGLRHDVPQGRARAALPGVWQGEKLVLIPVLEKGEKALAFCHLVSAGW